MKPGANRLIILLLLVGFFFLLLSIFALRQFHRGDPQFSGLSRALKSVHLHGNKEELEKLCRQSREMTRLDRTGRFIGLLTLFAFLMVISYAFWPKYQPILVKTGILESSPPSRETAEKNSSDPEASLKWMGKSIRLRFTADEIFHP